MPDRHVWWKLAASAGALAQDLVDELEFMGKGPTSYAPTGERREALVKAIVKANEARSLIVGSIQMDRSNYF